jgi:N6-adenosine-specific RNA methylase IME4
MSIEEIRAFPINDYADEQCGLFLWTTQGFIKEAFSIVEDWGFKFSRLITWDKKEGINWLGFTLNSEFVIFAYRGGYPIVVKPRCSFATTFHARRTKHSEKPDSFYAKLLPLTMEPRIDIFARRRHYGFDAWGDQVEAEPITIESYTN